VADSFLMRRLYDRPGTRTIPLYWFGGDQFGKEKNYRDYTNLVLSHLLTPTDCWHDPYHVHFQDPATGTTDWPANYAHAVAYHDTMLEAVGAVWSDVDLRPAWWRQPDTEVEAYAFRKDGCHLITALRINTFSTPRELHLGSLPLVKNTRNAASVDKPATGG
jgi:hypothetical protein